MSRHFPSGRFGYAMGYKTREAAQDAFDSMCNGDELSPGEGRIESYNASDTPHKQITRWAVTTE